MKILAKLVTSAREVWLNVADEAKAAGKEEQ